MGILSILALGIVLLVIPLGENLSIYQNPMRRACILSIFLSIGIYSIWLTWALWMNIWPVGSPINIPYLDSRLSAMGLPSSIDRISMATFSFRNRRMTFMLYLTQYQEFTLIDIYEISIFRIQITTWNRHYLSKSAICRQSWWGHQYRIWDYISLSPHYLEMRACC
jgi:hypothetical protein